MRRGFDEAMPSIMALSRSVRNDRLRTISAMEFYAAFLCSRRLGHVRRGISTTSGSRPSATARSRSYSRIHFRIALSDTPYLLPNAQVTVFFDLRQELISREDV